MTKKWFCRLVLRIDAKVCNSLGLEGMAIGDEDRFCWFCIHVQYR